VYFYFCLYSVGLLPPGESPVAVSNNNNNNNKLIKPLVQDKESIIQAVIKVVRIWVEKKWPPFFPHTASPIFPLCGLVSKQSVHCDKG
jgi:hypothetical protein